MSKKPKFTPGPWCVMNFFRSHAIHDGESFYDIDVLDEKECKEAKYNIILAAASPQLYTILGTLVERNRGNGESVHETLLETEKLLKSLNDKLL